ncbi:hypothetical protein [Flavobacterium sp.]|uniref:hypothetical protein n=1 Tax=Flavobacterium sp. TaxID=239 RepID=UPI0037C19C6F
MKASTIKLVLRQKIEDWLSTVDDDLVKQHIKENTIVSGGAIASMLAGEKVNDYDIYFRTKDTAKVIADYYVNKFNSSNGTLSTTAMRSCNPQVKVETRKNVKGVDEERVIIFMKSAGVASEGQSEYRYFESESETSADRFMDSLNASPMDTATDLADIVKDKKTKYRPVFFSENAITLSDKVQLVVRFYGSPSEIHENYDYAHSMCYYDYSKDELMLHPEALECILSKTLIYKGSLYPVASIFRVRKFIQRGWRITAGQLLKIIWQLNDIDLKDPAVLREQLIGVDQAYMHQLLRALETKDATQRIDTTYLAKLVDEIFE